MIKTGESFGSINDLKEDFNGYQGELTYLIARDYQELVEQYHSIKSAKTLVAAYSVGLKHCLVLMVNGKVIKKKRKKKN